MTELIRDEIGKPGVETFAGDVVPTLDALRGRSSMATHVRDVRAGAEWQRWLLMPRARLRWCPMGVVGMIGTWNYPLFLNAPPIAQALAAGNAVVWKPSELAVRSGQKIQQSLEEAGMPAGLVTAVFGGSKVGQALVESDLDKGFFTGGIENGRRVIAGLGARGIPAVAELSGFDAAIIWPDAPLHSTVDALTWAAYVGCGQTCVAVKRVYVSGIAAVGRRVLCPGQGDGGGRSRSAGDRHRTHDHGGCARAFRSADQGCNPAGARVLAGATSLSGPGWFYAPTVLQAETAKAETALAGAFGPVVLLRGVADVDAAVAATNSSNFELGASVWTRNSSATHHLASRLQAGMVSINDAVTPTATPGAVGGCKASGFGRTHGALGLREFAQPQVLFQRRPGGFRPQLFPYGRSSTVERFLAVYRRVFHRR